MNNYKRAIEIIGGEYDWYKIVVGIAKKNPKALVDAVDNRYDWRSEAKKLMADDKKIDAIKLCRLETGMALREAKEAVEAL